MSDQTLLPTAAPPEHITNVAVANIITRIGDIIAAEAESASCEWAEARAMESENIFMTNQVAELIANELRISADSASHHALLGLVMQIVRDITYHLIDPRIDFEARDV